MQLLKRWLSFRGRIGRRTFWLGHMIPSKVLAAALLLILFAAPSGYANSEALEILLIALILAALLMLPTWIVYAGLAKRCRDIGHSGWLSLIYLAPMVGLFFVIWCGIAKGRNAEKRGETQRAPERNRDPETV